MGIEKLPSSFHLAFSRILAPKVDKCVPYNYLHRNRPLLTSLSVRPNVTCSNVGPNVTLLCQCHCQHRLAFHGINIISTPMIRSYAVEQSSSGSRSKDNVVDPKARYGGLNPSGLKLGFEKLKELEDADEQVKKIFSLEYADDSEIQAYRRSKLVEKIQKDPADNSLTVKIALTTLTIRAAAKHYAVNKKDLGGKSLLLGSIGRRRKLLKELRKTDYQRFEKLLVELGITYTLPPPTNAFRKHTRKYLEKLTVWRKAREQRIEAMDEYLAEQRETKMREIAELKNELGVEFSEEEIKHMENKTDEEN